MQVGYFVDVARETVTELAQVGRETFPRLVSAVVFLTIAYAAIRVALAVLRRSLRRVYPDEQWLVGQLVVAIVGVFLWFGAALVLLNIVGLGQLAASLGTATGFLALGVSYALSEMIEDAVAGVYLLRDPDFNPGDRVSTADFDGTVAAIELRKTRVEQDGGDTVVVANRKIEQKWTKKAGAA
jgi:small-conductance mechanosensitive channel